MYIIYSLKVILWHIFSIPVFLCPVKKLRMKFSICRLILVLKFNLGGIGDFSSVCCICLWYRQVCGCLPHALRGWGGHRVTVPSPHLSYQGLPFAENGVSCQSASPSNRLVHTPHSSRVSDTAYPFFSWEMWTQVSWLYTGLLAPYTISSALLTSRVLLLSRLTSNSEPCLSASATGIKGLHYHTWPATHTFNFPFHPRLEVVCISNCKSRFYLRSKLKTWQY